MRFAQRGGGDFAQANLTHLACAHEVTQCTHAVLNRHLFVPAVQVVQVNHIRAQTRQAVFTIFTKRLGTTVNHALHTFGEGHARHAAFAAQGDLAAVRFERFAHQQLIGAKAIERGGVKQRHA